MRLKRLEEVTNQRTPSSKPSAKLNESTGEVAEMEHVAEELEHTQLSKLPNEKQQKQIVATGEKKNQPRVIETSPKSAINSKREGEDSSTPSYRDEQRLDTFLNWMGNQIRADPNFALRINRTAMLFGDGGGPPPLLSAAAASVMPGSVQLFVFELISFFNAYRLT